MRTVRRPRKPRDYSVAALEAIFPSIIRVMSGVRQVVHRDLDLSYNDYKALAAIRQHGPVTLDALRRELRVASSTASTMVGRLVRAGLVRRSADPGNPRRLHLAVSPRGERHLARLEQALIDNYRHLLGELPVDDRLRLVEAFGVILDILCDHETRAQTRYG